MEELTQIANLLSKLVELFGGTITTLLVLLFVYLKFLKKGNHLLVIGNNNGKKGTNPVNPLCEQRLDHCNKRFDDIDENLEKGEKKFEEYFKTISETHTNVAVLMERTEHLKGVKP